MTHDFDGKVAVVTAAGQSIGFETARLLALAGARVAVCELDPDKCQAAAQAIRDAGGIATAYPMDATDQAQVDATVAGVVAQWGGIDLLMNVVGGTRFPRRADEMLEEEWQATINTNLHSVFRCVKAVVPQMRKRGGGAIVNTSSGAGLMPSNRNVGYAAAKGAVNNLTKAMALDYAKDNIRVNAILPGMMLSPRIRGWMSSNPGFANMGDGICPLGRAGEPVEAARAAVFLLSDDASYITGALLPVDGGAVAGNYIEFMESGDTGERVQGDAE